MHLNLQRKKRTYHKGVAHRLVRQKQDARDDGEPRHTHTIEQGLDAGGPVYL